MAKNQKATLSAVEVLHGTIATVLTEVLEHKEEETQLVDMGEGLMEEQGTGNMRYSVSPAMMAQAINFVHKQGVVADLQGDQNTDKLASLLDKNVKRSRMGDPKVASLDQHRAQQG